MTITSAVHAFPLALFTGLLGLAALTDLQEYRIPNSVNLAIAALFPVYAMLPGAGVDIVGSVVLATVVLAGGTGLFALGVLGGGDVKLITAVSLWIGPAAFLDFLLVMAVCGGAVALIQSSQWRLGVAQFLADRGETGFARTLIGRDVPYAVAIAAAAVAVMPVPPILGAAGTIAG
ncbi:MAG: pilus assembly protein CpaA [Rhodospirillales bacterium CG15_BIG_FIL_POST_REV_8_21_14_020_66_15]|nr:MAG: pilus assembly protein CpaA [Rhodospirillales bacterium CG15_BIG_FIL_POST_REV_8_21_14_020_66_15]